MSRPKRRFGGRSYESWTPGDAMRSQLQPISNEGHHMAAHADRAELLRLINGFQASQAIQVAATLRLADHLAPGAKTAAELAALTHTHAVALHRLLRALASIAVFL